MRLYCGDWRRHGVPGSTPIYFDVATPQRTVGPNVAGYPRDLGKRNLTTSLVGVTEPTTSAQAMNFLCLYKGDPNNPITDGLTGIPPLLATGPYEPFDLHKLDAELTTKLLGKIYEKQAASQSGVMLGELMSTMRMLKNPLKGLENALFELNELWQTLRRIKPRHKNHELVEAFSGLWLEWVYGILPLTSDIAGHVETVQSILAKTEYVNVSATLNDHMLRPLDAAQDVVAQMRYSVVGRQQCSYSGKARALISARAAGPGFDPGNFGLRLLDFVPTVYALIPYSFLLGYVSNLDSWLNSHFVAWEQVCYAWGGHRVENNSQFEFSGTSVSDPIAWEITSMTPGRLEISQDMVARWKISPATSTIIVAQAPFTRQLINVAALAGSLSKVRF